MEDDDVHKEREIIVDKPFKTTKIKVHFPASQSQTKFEEGYISGRIDVVVVEDEKSAVVATGAKMGSPKECTSNKDCNAKRAILDLGSTTNQSSAWKSTWNGEKNLALNSATGFATGEKQKEDVFVEVMFPENKLYKVTQMILKKRGDKEGLKKVIEKVNLDYFNGTAWIEYNNGDGIKTGQLPDDDGEKERKLDFVPFLASKVRMKVSRGNRNSNQIYGRLDFMVLTEVRKKKAEDKYELVPAITAEWCKADAECTDFHAKHWKYFYGEKDCANLKTDTSI